MLYVDFWCFSFVKGKVLIYWCINLVLKHSASSHVMQCMSVSGCYISKCVYYRTGEKSLDCYYRPYHRVEYYRYVRFFPEGTVNDKLCVRCICCNVCFMFVSHVSIMSFCMLWPEELSRMEFVVILWLLQ